MSELIDLRMISVMLAALSLHRRQALPEAAATDPLETDLRIAFTARAPELRDSYRGKGFIPQLLGSS